MGEEISIEEKLEQFERVSIFSVDNSINSRDVGAVARNVEFCAWIEVVFTSWNWSTHFLVSIAQRPPMGIPLSLRNSIAENIPTPFVDQQAEWQERDTFKRF